MHKLYKMELFIECGISHRNTGQPNLKLSCSERFNRKAVTNESILTSQISQPDLHKGNGTL